MNELIRNMPGSFWRMWLLCLFLPLPPIAFWRSHDGRFIGLCLFFTGCTMLVVRSFSGDCLSPLVLAAERRAPQVLWRERMAVVGLALVVSWSVFSASCLVLNDPHDRIAPVLGFAAMIPALCIAPYYALTLRKPIPAVVFTVFSLGGMKLVAGSISCLVYGWHADQLGQTALTWTHPNVIVCALLSSASVLSLVFYTMGTKRFRTVCNRGGGQNRVTRR